MNYTSANKFNYLVLVQPVKEQLYLTATTSASFLKKLQLGAHFSN